MPITLNEPCLIKHGLSDDEIEKIKAHAKSLEDGGLSPEESIVKTIKEWRGHTLDTLDNVHKQLEEKRNPNPLSQHFDKLNPSFQEYAKNNPEEFLQQISQQAHGVYPDGKPARGGAPDSIFGVPKEIVDHAKQKYPYTQTVDPANNFNDFKDHIITQINNVGNDKLVHRIDIDTLQHSDKEKAIADIRSGKNSTKRAQKILAGIRDMFDRRQVDLIRGGGTQGERISIPFDDYFREPLEPKELDATASIHPDLADIINKEGVTLDNLDNLKHLFNGFPYSKDDYDSIRRYLEANSGNADTQKNPEGSQRVEPQNEGSASNTTTGTSNEGNGNAGQPPTSNTPGENSEAETIGIRHESRQKTAAAQGEDAPQRGKTTEGDSVKRGQELIKNGADPEQVGKDFKSDGKISSDAMSIVRAHYAELAKRTREAIKEFGIDSKEDKAAKAEQSRFFNEYVQPMKTAWSQIGMDIQGETDLDTGDYVSMRAAMEEKQGHELSKDQVEKLKDLTSKNEALKTQLEETEAKLKEETDKQSKKIEELSNKLKSLSKENKTNKNYAEKARRVANKFRQLKTKPFKFKDKDGNEYDVEKQGISWNDLVELGAKAIEKTGDIADGIAAIVEKIKDSDFYAKLSSADKELFKEQLQSHYESSLKDTPEAKNVRRLEKELEDLKSGKVKNPSDKRPLSEREKDLQEQIRAEKSKLGLIKSKSPKPEEAQQSSEEKLKDLQQQFVSKKGNKFTPEESQSIYKYGKENYLDKNVSWEDMLKNVATDLGLSFEQAANAIITPKTKEINLNYWRQQHDLQKSRNATIQYVESKNKNGLQKVWDKVIGYPRAVKTALHGHIFAGTHYPMGLVTPSQWGIYFKGIGNMWKAAYGETGQYELMVKSLVNDKYYNIARKAGLENDPEHVGIDDYERSGKLIGRIGETGTRGFFGLKWTRQQIFNRYFDALTSEEKNDDTAKSIAWLVNNSTGATNLKIPKSIQDGLFSAGMESARWGRLVRNPLEAAARGTRILSDLAKGNPINAADKVFVKVWSTRVGQQLGTMIGLLFINAYVQSKINPKNPVNLTNPSKSDFLKLKVSDTDIDISGGVLGVKNFLSTLATVAQRDKSYKQEAGDIGGAGVKYIRGKLSPAYGDMAEIPLGTDYSGNILPFSKKPVPAGKRKIGWAEYLTSKVSPIFVEDAAKNVIEGSQDNGVPKSKSEKLVNGIIETGIKFGFGAHANPSLPPKAATNPRERGSRTESRGNRR